MVRLAYALGKIEMAENYRESMLKLVSQNLAAQFDHADTRTPFVLLPSLCCQACGESAERSVGVSMAWFLLQVSASLLDKVEDQELESIQFEPHDVGIVTNLTTGMVFVAQWILNHLELDQVDAGAAWDIQRAFHETVLSVCSGQHLDLSVNAPDLSTCWRIAEEKSGAAFGLACYAGARLATNRSDVLDAFQRFGRELGTIVQVDDDIEDLADVSASGSPRRVDKTLIGAYMKFAASPPFTTEDAGHVACRTQDTTQQFVRSGSILYLQLEKLKYAALAEKALTGLKLNDDFHRHLVSLIHQESRIISSVN